VHTPDAKSTLRTADDDPTPSTQPPRRSTCPWSLSLSSIATAAVPLMRPHDSGGRKPSSSASESHPKISTLAVCSRLSSCPSKHGTSPPPPSSLSRLFRPTSTISFCFCCILPALLSKLSKFAAFVVCLPSLSRRNKQTERRRNEDRADLCRQSRAKNIFLQPPSLHRYTTSAVG
jgi:hypothetical protein